MADDESSRRMGAAERLVVQCDWRDVLDEERRSGNMNAMTNRGGHKPSGTSSESLGMNAQKEREK